MKFFASSTNLTTGESCVAMDAVHVLEDHAIKFLILKEEDKHHPIDWKKLGSPNNWVKLGIKLGNVRVVKTSRHIIIHPGSFGISTLTNYL